MAFSKLFKRHRSATDGTAKSTSGPSDSLAVPLPDLRFSTSLPQLVVPQNGRPIGPEGLPIVASPGNGRSGSGAPAADRHPDVSIPSSSKLPPPTVISPASDNMGEMWRIIDDRAENTSKTEKIMNRITDTASGAVAIESSSDGVVGLVKTVLANDEVKAIGNTVIEGVPAIMSDLETLTQIHPFLKAAYLPFKLIYHQEAQRRDNDEKRTTLFGKIRDVMLILLEDMKKDIEECYNVLNAQEKRSIGIKFLKASSWNKELGSYAARFTNRREELTFALSMRIVVTMEEMNASMKTMMAMFSGMLSPQERNMDQPEWCSGPVGPADKGRPGFDETAAVAALRKEYREDIQGVIQQNLESYSTRFAMELDDLGKDLDHKIQHQGDRLIMYLRGGPHQRIKDKYNKLFTRSTELPRERPISSVPEEDDDRDDPETDIAVPLPDDWIAEYLQVKRLRYLERNSHPPPAFVALRSHMMQRRWIQTVRASQQYPRSMRLRTHVPRIGDQISIKMPGNTRYVNAYIEGCWEQVTTLTLCIEPCDSDPWLAEKFAEYGESQEAILKERRGKIQYDIDASETVSLILRGGRIEASIFILSALLMRRHLAKMHLCLKQDIDPRELRDDIDTVDWVINAVWTRFRDLKEIADLKSIFEQYSCGLFKHYWEWQDWVRPKYFMEADLVFRIPVSDEITEFEPSELTGILAYTDTIQTKLSSDAPPPVASSPAPAVEALSADKISVVDSMYAISAPSWELGLDGSWSETSSPFLALTRINFEPGDAESDSETEVVLSGDGLLVNGGNTTITAFRGSVDQGLARRSQRLRRARPDSCHITGITPYPALRNAPRRRANIIGTVNSANQPAGSLALDFQRSYIDEGTWFQYRGTYLPERARIRLFKKVAVSAIMCSRPMVAELNNKELWSFATKAVVQDLRRNKPSLLHVYERMIDMRPIFGLMHRDDRWLLDETGQLEYSKLLHTFSYEQMTELCTLYAWYTRAGNLHPVVCLDCDDLIRSRTTGVLLLQTRMHRFKNAPGRSPSPPIPSHDFQEIKRRAGSTLETACSFYHEVAGDPSLTVPLPTSPVADDTPPSETNSTSSTADIQTQVHMIVDDTPTPTPIAAQRMTTPVGLIALDTDISVDLTSEQPPATPSSSSDTTELLSKAVTPEEEILWEDERLNCTHGSVIRARGLRMNCHRGSIRPDIGLKGARPIWRAGTLLNSPPRGSVVGERAPEDNGAAANSTLPEPATPLESQWEQLEKRIQEHVDKRMDEVELRLTSRLANIEELLKVIAGQEASLSGNPKRFHWHTSARRAVDVVISQCRLPGFYIPILLPLAPQLTNGEAVPADCEKILESLPCTVFCGL
ncbi:hypothetical protein B0H14DRAFT_2583962 [Mycena olivaceomarginata]|nr:hypothetical protein B0H14DRAFT_2583962 [Mycena olivaceomarginata]